MPRQAFCANSCFALLDHVSLRDGLFYAFFHTAKMTMQEGVSYYDLTIMLRLLIKIAWIAASLRSSQ
jgi:hypothetical protein